MAQLAAGEPIDFDELRAWQAQAEPWLQRLGPDLAAKLHGLPDPATWVLPAIRIADNGV